VPASDDADLEDVAFFARAGAVASVERLRGFAGIPGAVSEPPRIDCAGAPAAVVASDLCAGWRAAPPRNLTLLTGGVTDLMNATARRAAAGDGLSGVGDPAAAGAPGFVLVLSQAVVDGGGAPLPLGAFNATSLTVSMAKTQSVYFLDPEAPLRAAEAAAPPSLLLPVALGVCGAALALLALLCYARRRRAALQKQHLFSGGEAGAQNPAVSVASPLRRDAWRRDVTEDRDAFFSFERAPTAAAAARSAPATERRAERRKREYKKLKVVESAFASVTAGAALSTVVRKWNRGALDEVGAALLLQRAWRLRRVQRARAHFALVAKFDSGAAR
jgi:hypothetical protein